MTDWDAELKKIDRQLESISDSALKPMPARSAPPPPSPPKAGVPPARVEGRTWPALLRLALATMLAVGILFWPYPSRCGLGLAGYLAALTGVTAAGLWSSVWTWRHRTPRAHVISLLLVVYGITLAAVEILPRVGYAKADIQRPTGFSCVAPAVPAPVAPAPQQKTR